MSLTPIVAFNITLLVVFTLCFFYQIIYIVIVFKKKSYPYKPARTLHRYAFCICAHNEGVVIGNLIRSIKKQEYPQELIDVFVFADNCTDDTVERAREAGAFVYERHDSSKRGKSWVMDFGFKRIFEDHPHTYEAFFIFDADNIVTPTYVARMNDVFDEGYPVITSYRNSKNFGSSWISSGYGTWFMREAQYLNNARMILGTNAAVSGTGYLVSAKVIERMQGWDFHLLTEDIEFSAYCAINGLRIGYCGEAMFYDEQPLTFEASWKQRMRWTKGFYQVFYHCGDALLKTAVIKRRFAGYDMLMTIAPAMILTLVSVFVNSFVLFTGTFAPDLIAEFEMRMCAWSVAMSFLSMYVIFFILGVLTTITERRNIHASTLRICTNLFTFPLFMLTYVPIALAALVKQVEWVPTKHTISKTLEDITE